MTRYSSDSSARSTCTARGRRPQRARLAALAQADSIRRRATRARLATCTGSCRAWRRWPRTRSRRCTRTAVPQARRSSRPRLRGGGGRVRSHEQCKRRVGCGGGRRTVVGDARDGVLQLEALEPAPEHVAVPVDVPAPQPADDKQKQLNRLDHKADARQRLPRGRGACAALMKHLTGSSRQTVAPRGPCARELPSCEPAGRKKCVPDGRGRASRGGAARALLRDLRSVSSVKSTPNTASAAREQAQTSTPRLVARQLRVEDRSAAPVRQRACSSQPHACGQRRTA